MHSIPLPLRTLPALTIALLILGCGSNPAPDPTCEPVCETGRCGADDGCGALCGCPGGQTCQSDGQCAAISSCADGVHGEGESDVDCGGDCRPCEDGKACVTKDDCKSDNCVANVCAAASCSDGVLNGSETDVDCGGAVCAACALDKSCAKNEDCESLACGDGRCVAGACANGKKDGEETDLDCGGGTCPACALEMSCVKNRDCASDNCSQGRCAVAPCANGKKDGAETDVDCGGDSCQPCVNDKTCSKDTDCASAFCNAGLCGSDPCGNGVKDGDETDVDCGGTRCGGCADTKVCEANRDCLSLLCSGRTCQQPTCSDGRKNGDETDVDCGGACPNKCASGKGCVQTADCADGLTCPTGVCADTASGEATIERRVNAGTDAIASYLMDIGAWNMFYGTSLNLGRHYDVGNVSYHSALRFTGVQIPKGAIIKSARVYWHPTNEVDSNRNLFLNIYAEKKGNSPPFDPSNYDSNRPDQRLKTTAMINQWMIRCNKSCTDLTEWDCPQRKLDCWNRAIEFAVPKDLKALVQEVIDLPDWAPGNALTLFFVNSVNDQEFPKPEWKSSRTIVGYDPTGRGAEASPRLVVVFEKP